MMFCLTTSFQINNQLKICLADSTHGSGVQILRGKIYFCYLSSYKLTRLLQSCFLFLQELPESQQWFSARVRIYNQIFLING